VGLFLAVGIAAAPAVAQPGRSVLDDRLRARGLSADAHDQGDAVVVRLKNSSGQAARLKCAFELVYGERSRKPFSITREVSLRGDEERELKFRQTDYLSATLMDWTGRCEAAGAVPGLTIGCPDGSARAFDQAELMVRGGRAVALKLKEPSGAFRVLGLADVASQVWAMDRADTPDHAPARCGERADPSDAPSRKTTTETDPGFFDRPHDDRRRADVEAEELAREATREVGGAPVTWEWCHGGKRVRVTRAHLLRIICGVTNTPLPAKGTMQRLIEAATPALENLDGVLREKCSGKDKPKLCPSPRRTTGKGSEGERG
jgi:hypothetical protein